MFFFNIRDVPGFDRNLKPRAEFMPSTGLRIVVVPASLLSEFVILAHSNTQNNVETCGILAGKLVRLDHLLSIQLT